jgi:hypothetical protein
MEKLLFMIKIKPMLLRSLVLISILGIFGCKATQKVSPLRNVDDLFALMQGSFNSAQQAAQDSSYYDISLHMYPIWKKDKQYKWLYVEQSVTSMQDRPYRQRVYRLERNEKGAYISSVYELPNAEASIGKWQDVSFFDQWSPQDLKEREGCAVFLRKMKDGSFEGETDGKKCKSSLRGATYATSRVSIKKGEIASWDQGFNDKDEQVWGAVKGGYKFMKQ